jgi:phosphoglycolate phosphatase
MSVSPLLIFDLDDTLIDSFPAYVSLHQRLAEELEWRIPSTDELIAYGPTWEATLRRLFPDRDVQVFIDRYELIADELVYPAFPGVIDALDTLNGRGHSMWVVSKRSTRRIISRMVDAGIRPEVFKGVFANEDQPAPKPDPRCFEPVWDAVGGQRDAVYFGDRHEDRLAADAAGLRFVGVSTGPEGSRGAFADLPVENRIATAAEVPSWVTRHLEGLDV